MRDFGRFGLRCSQWCIPAWPTLFCIVAAFLVVNIVYSLKLKNMVILDVMCIASGFVLRVLGGTVLADVQPSGWLILCTIMIALFLAFCKRRHEIISLNDMVGTHRRVLSEYGVTFLDQMIAVAAAGSLMSYALYTVSEETVVHFGTRNLVFTVPFVIYGIFRYLFLIYRKALGRNPTSLVLGDPPLLVNIGLWLVITIYLYFVLSDFHLTCQYSEPVKEIGKHRGHLPILLAPSSKLQGIGKFRSPARSHPADRHKQKSPP